MKKYKICSYLKDALYLAPDEIRACCQRFFYEGKMRGDAKLIKVKKGSTPSTNDITEARKKLFDQIQKDESVYCKGCKYLNEVEEKPNLNASVKHLSIEHHTFCNLRCNYCSPFFYGGKKPNYDVVAFTSDLADEGVFNNCNQVVWGGGEPTLDKSFELIVKKINRNVSPKIYHRVFTNSVRFSKPLKKFIDEGLVKITTSIDAGDEETFKIVRGRKKFNEVFENLKIYSEKNPEIITIKYIFTDENSNKKNIKGFLKKIEEYSLKDCCFQISTNYKKESISSYLKWIAYIFASLAKIGVKKIFLDDLISVRMTELKPTEFQEIKTFLEDENLDEVLDINVKDLIIYGSGQIGKDLVSKSSLFKKVKNYVVVDSDKAKIGNKFFDKIIMPPSILENENRKILIASAQSYHQIYLNILSLQKTSKNILTKLII